MYDTQTTATAANASTGPSATVMIVYLVIIVLMVVSMWKVFTKAGQPGWAAIVPFYNVYILLKMVGRPAWWLLLFLVPLVNIVISVIVYLDLAKAFGRSSVFGVFGLLLFPYIGFPMLAFGKDVYTAPATATPAATAGPAPTPPVAPAV